MGPLEESHGQVQVAFQLDAEASHKQLASRSNWPRTCAPAVLPTPAALLDRLILLHNALSSRQCCQSAGRTPEVHVSASRVNEQGLQPALLAQSFLQRVTWVFGLQIRSEHRPAESSFGSPSLGRKRPAPRTAQFADWRLRFPGFFRARTPQTWPTAKLISSLFLS